MASGSADAWWQNQVTCSTIAKGQCTNSGGTISCESLWVPEGLGARRVREAVGSAQSIRRGLWVEVQWGVDLRSWFFSHALYTLLLVRCIQHVGGELEQAIDFNFACYGKYCIHKKKKKLQMYGVFKVTCNTRMLGTLMTTKITRLEVACTFTLTAWCCPTLTRCTCVTVRTCMYVCIYVYMFVLNSVIHTVNPNDRYKIPVRDKKQHQSLRTNNKDCSKAWSSSPYFMTTPTVIMYVLSSSSCSKSSFYFNWKKTSCVAILSSTSSSKRLQQ